MANKFKQNELCEVTDERLPQKWYECIIIAGPGDTIPDPKAPVPTNPLSVYIIEVDGIPSTMVNGWWLSPEKYLRKLRDGDQPADEEWVEQFKRDVLKNEEKV